MTKRIPLTQGKFALVDDDTYDALRRHKWHYCGGYARRAEAPRQRIVMMSRFILSAPPGMDVDHINRDKLDNRRENLRIATRAQNLHNAGPRSNTSSRFKGVSWSKTRKRWVVYLHINGVFVYNKGFTDEIEAARAYDAVARQYFGEFAYLNFPEEEGN